MERFLVLVVDDDRDTRELYRLVFEDGGFRVAEADSIAAGIDAALRHRPHVIVTDWILDDGDGFALCEALRRHGRTRLVPLVAATGMTLSPDARARARHLGCATFLTKPIDLDTLVRATADAVQAPQVRTLRAAAARVRRFVARVRKGATFQDVQTLTASELVAGSGSHAGSPVALIVADDNGRYVAANDRAAELTGYAPEVLTTLSVGDLAPEPESRARQRLWNTFIEEGTQEGVCLVKRRDGLAVPLWYVAVANIAPGLHLSALSPAAAGVLFPASGPSF
jgi:two-component system, chemotaxis family, response regulator PixH